MKHFLTVGAMMVCLCVSAQEQYMYPLKSLPTGFDTYGDVAYYYDGGKVYNMRNYRLSKTDRIVDFKVNPLGSSFVVITSNKNGKKQNVAVYDLWKQNKKIGEIAKMKFTPVAVCYTGDARYFLIADKEGYVRQFEALTCKPSITMKLQNPATSLTVSKDNYYMAAAYDNMIEIWNMQDHMMRHKITMDANVKRVTFSDDSNQLAVLTADGELNVYNTSTFIAANTIDALGLAVDCSFHPEGKYIAVVTGKNRISVLNLLNSRERKYIDSDSTNINFVRFVRNKADKDVYLAYSAQNTMTFRNMGELSPLRSRLIADKLKERIDEWEKRLPGETLEAYNLRVNDQTRMEQISLFEREIATEMALGELGMAEMSMGSYNSDAQMLSISLGESLQDIYLSVPQSDVAAFIDPSNLEFRNVKYGLNNEDEFEMLYADIYNKATGKTYTYNNLEGQFIDYIADEASFAPLELVQQTSLEENSLMDMTESVINEAMEQKLLSEHTHISVKTHIQPAIDAEGNSIRNYQVGVTYTVDNEFSSREDYAGGKYKIEDSHAGVAMLKIVKQALESDFSKYMVEGKRLKIIISGTADATPIRRTIDYDGCYGDFNDEPILSHGEPSSITVTEKTGISDNDQLAFLRAVGVKDYLFKHIVALSDMQVEISYDILVSEETGSEYRKVSVEFTFEDAFEK